ncbi:hypothetical protein HY412_00105 [Candidatus Kaiserbacteria bacterium]|nr:hypothetical protein [Candidatus Kaiserbacteria bacterium]
MQARQFGITKKSQPQKQPKKASKLAYRAIDGELFDGRQMYMDAKDRKGYFPVGASTFVFVTSTRYHAISGELFGGRQTYWSPTGKKGFFDANSNEFHSATAAQLLRLVGKFVQPLYVVKTDQRPTGHYDGEKHKKAA